MYLQQVDGISAVDITLVGTTRLVCTVGIVAFSPDCTRLLHVMTFYTTCCPVAAIRSIRAAETEGRSSPYYIQRPRWIRDPTNFA